LMKYRMRSLLVRTTSIAVVSPERTMAIRFLGGVPTH
jgi:hypothetical protein